MDENVAVLGLFHPAVRCWFCESYADPTPPQALGFMCEDQELIYANHEECPAL